jgi:DNA-binding NarL/FixJ family response regulator
MRASLTVLLKSLFPFIQIERTDDVSIVIRLLAARQPWLVLIDADLPDDRGWSIGKEIQRKYPGYRPVVLAHSTRQVDRSYEAGLDALLLEGMTAASLAEAIAVFLPNCAA